MESTQTKSNPTITRGKTPENFEAPVNKNQNGNAALHTDQSNRDVVKKINGGTEADTPYSNSNIENYLGSEKMDEKLSTQTEKFQNDMRKSEADKGNFTMNDKPDIDDDSDESDDGALNNPKAPTEHDKGSGGSSSSNKNADKPDIRYDTEDDW